MKRMSKKTPPGKTKPAPVQTASVNGKGLINYPKETKETSNGTT